MIEHGKEFWTYFFEKTGGRFTVALIRAPYLNNGEMIINGYLRKVPSEMLFETSKDAREHAIDALWQESGSYALLASMLDRFNNNAVSVTEEQVKQAISKQDRFIMRDLASGNPQGEA